MPCEFQDHLFFDFVVASAATHLLRVRVWRDVGGQPEAGFCSFVVDSPAAFRSHFERTVDPNDIPAALLAGVDFPFIPLLLSEFTVISQEDRDDLILSFSVHLRDADTQQPVDPPVCPPRCFRLPPHAAAPRAEVMVRRV